MKEVYIQLECNNEDNCAVIAYVAGHEWEAMSQGMMVNGRAASMGQRSKLRQMLLAARKAAQTEPQPVDTQTPVATGPSDPMAIATAHCGRRIGLPDARWGA